MTLYTTHITPRLRYMAHWLGMRLLHAPLTITTQLQELPTTGKVLNYSNQPLPNIDSFWIVPHPLLFQTGIVNQQIAIQKKDGTPYFFPTQGDYHFDVLAAAFYLIQRYEEYEPHTKDEYGRYAHQNSLAFKHQFLHLPLVDIWVQDLAKHLGIGEAGGHVQPAANHDSFVPTYDVDIAYRYKGKGWIRSTVAFFRSCASLQLFKERWKVLLHQRQDPFDIFTQLDALHQQYQLQPIYFFLLAQKAKGYDKNIHPAKALMQKLMVRIAAAHTTGIHPSWQSGDNPALLQQEIGYLQTYSGKSVVISRQHYIRMRLPDTYHQLILEGITADYSMGYGSINGFRASTCVPYTWYNLQTEATTELTIFPFCFMEANAIFEQKDTPMQALEELKAYYNAVQKVGGTFIPIFHNHLMGTGVDGTKWMQVLIDFLAWRQLQLDE